MRHSDNLLTFPRTLVKSFLKGLFTSSPCLSDFSKKTTTIKTDWNKVYGTQEDAPHRCTKNHGTPERRCRLMHSSWCWVSGTRGASSHRGSPPQSRAIWMHFIFFQLARCCQDLGGNCQLRRRPCHSSGRCNGGSNWVVHQGDLGTCGSAIILIKRFTQSFEMGRFSN